MLHGPTCKLINTAAPQASGSDGGEREGCIQEAAISSNKHIHQAPTTQIRNCDGQVADAMDANQKAITGD